MKQNNFYYIKNKRKFGVFKEKVELNIDLFNDGLFVFGAKDSAKKDFLIDLSFKIVNNNIKVVFLTDSHYIINKILKKIDVQSKKSLSNINLLDFFKNKNIQFEHDINILSLDSTSEVAFSKKGKRHFPDTLSQLSKLENTVIIIDEVLNDSIDKNDLFEGINKLKKSNVGLIIGDYYPSFYNEVYTLIDNHILYYMYDAPFEFKDHPAMINNQNYITFFEKRELNYQYKLFTFYKHRNNTIINDLKIK